MTGRLAALLLLGLASIGGARADLVGHGAMVRAVAVSPDGRTVLTGSFDYTAAVWDLQTQALKGRLVGHAGPVNAVAFVGAGRTAASGGDDGVVLLWDLTTMRLRHRIEGARAKVVALAAAPGGDLLAAASWDRHIRIYDAASGGERLHLTLDSEVNAVAFAADGRTLFSGDKDGTISVWALPMGDKVGELRGHDLAVTHLALSADGQRLLSAGLDGTIRVWQGGGWRQQRVLHGHDGPVFAVSLSPDGERAVSAGGEGELRLWDLATGTLIRGCAAHRQPIWAIAHAASGPFVLSASADATVRVWDIETCTAIGSPAPLAAAAEPWLSSEHPGARTYRACAPCHALTAGGPQRAGPHFAGLFGRRAGSVAGYPYSPALREAAVTWDTNTLETLLAEGPERFLPGTRMPLQRVGDAGERAALVDYLRLLTAPPEGAGGPPR